MGSFAVAADVLPPPGMTPKDARYSDSQAKPISAAVKSPQVPLLSLRAAIVCLLIEAAVPWSYRAAQ